MSSKPQSGYFKSGPMSLEDKEKISRGQIKRWAEIKKQELSIRSGVKLCTQCGERKPWDLDDPILSAFSPRKRELKSGSTTVYVSAECKQCAVERKRRNKEKNGEAAREARREYMRKHLGTASEPGPGREVWLKNQREGSAARRRRDGAAVRGSWLKYRTEEGRAQSLDAEPFLTWLDEYIRATEAQLSENDQRMILRVRESKTITLVQVDRILTNLGRPDILNMLYAG